MRFTLIDRPKFAVLFRPPGRAVVGGQFLRDAARLARTLPDRQFVTNICQDRYYFAVGLAAALIRGQVSLLSGDTSPGVMARLASEYPGAYALSDLPVPSCPMLVHLSPAAFTGDGSGENVAIDPARLAIVVLTSGSTGAPVATAKCWGELVARTRAAGARFALREDEPATIVGTVPPHHMYGLETTILLPLHAAASSHCGPAFYPADISAALASVPSPRILVSTPFHLRAVLRSGQLAAPPEQVISATAPLEPALAGEIEAVWGTELREIFGASEVGSIASRRTVTEPDWTLYPGIELGGTEDAPMIGAAHAAPRRLADLIERTPAGFRLIGRHGDVVKLAGRRASLLGLTHILSGLEGVRDGVFLAPEPMDREDGRPARLAAVAVAPGRTVQDMTEELRLRIDPVFLPRPLVLLDQLPRDALGKMPRARLLALLGENAGGSLPRAGRG